MALALVEIIAGGIGRLALADTSSSPQQAPTSPPAEICQNVSVLSGPSSAPAGAITVPAGDDSVTSDSDGSYIDSNYQMTADKTYWFAPGTHTLSTGEYDTITPADGDTFIGAPGAILNGQGDNQEAFSGTAAGVTVEYLTIENFAAPEDQMVVNHSGASNWTVERDTIEDNGGAGVALATNSVVSENCLTDNSQYGFSSFGGSSNVTLSDNEISHNDSGDAYDRGSGSISCGCSGGGKFWDTSGATVSGNYVHDNATVGLWVDTDNSGFDISDNYISGNGDEGIIYEISYNGLISDNTLVDNAWYGGPLQGGQPMSAIYISESGGNGGVPGAYSGSLTITGNVLIDNWSGVSLWENANRWCGNTDQPYCTLMDPSVYTPSSCESGVPDSTPAGNPDYFDNCRWKTQDVTVSDNIFDFTPSDIGSACTAANDCGFNGIWSIYGNAPYDGPIVDNDISNNQHNHFSDNTYCGSWSFMAFDQTDDVDWSQWTEGISDPNGSGDNFGPQDSGSSLSDAGACPSSPAAAEAAAAPSSTTSTTSAGTPTSSTTTLPPPAPTSTTTPTTAPPPAPTSTTTSTTLPPPAPTSTTTSTTSPPPAPTSTTTSTTSPPPAPTSTTTLPAPAPTPTTSTPAPPTALSPPTDLEANASGTAVTLTWSNPPGSCGLDSYGPCGNVVFRNGTPIAILGFPNPLSDSYTDSAAPTGSDSYTVAAYDADGDAVFSDTVTVPVGSSDATSDAAATPGSGTTTAAGPQQQSVAVTSSDPGSYTAQVPGEPVVGETLTAWIKGWAGSPGSVTYQWLACDASGCQDIPGATSPTYVVSAADEGDSLEVAVGFAQPADPEPAPVTVATLTVARVESKNLFRMPWTLGLGARGGGPSSRIGGVFLALLLFGAALFLFGAGLRRYLLVRTRVVSRSHSRS